MDLFPYAKSFGIYNCRNIAGSSTKSQHSCGRAWDCRLATLSNGRARTDLGHPIIQFLAKYSTAMGIVDQIYDRVIYDDRTPNGRYYGGVHPHYDHIHITQTPDKAKNLRYQDYVNITGIDPRQGTGTTGEYEMKKGDPKSAAVAELQRALRVLFGFDIGTWAPIAGKSLFDGRPAFGPGEDGDFGGTTETHVKSLQKGLGLAQTGVVDGALASIIFAKYGSGGSAGTVDQTARSAAAAAQKTASAASPKGHGHTATTTVK